MRAGRTLSGTALSTRPWAHFVALGLPKVLSLPSMALQEFLSHELAAHCFQPVNVLHSLRDRTVLPPQRGSTSCRGKDIEALYWMWELRSVQAAELNLSAQGGKQVIPLH